MPSFVQARPVHSAYLRAAGSLLARKPTRRGRAPGTMATSSLICWRSVSATTDVSILLTVTGISPFDCGELGVLAELLTPGAEQLVGSRRVGGAAVI